MKLFYPQRNLLRRLLIGGTAVFVSIAAYSSYQAVRNLTLESLKKNALLEVQQGANSIDNWLLNLKVHVQTLANLPVVRSMNWEAAAPYLETEVLRFADVSGIAIAGRDGWRNVTGGKRAYVGDRSFFKKAMAGQTNVSDPLISRVAGLPSIVVGTPIRQEFSIAVAPVGELHTVVKLNRITQVVNQLKYGDNSYAFALNSKGEAIVHPQTLLSTPEQTTPSFTLSADKNLAAIARRMVSKQQGIELTHLGGTWNYVAYLPLAEADWSVALVISRDTIESPLRLLDILALGVAGLASLLLLVLWQVQSFKQTHLKKSNEDLEQRVIERTAALSTALEQLQQSQLRLVQNEKMSSLGQLVAGVAHEINNPVNFIHGNLSYLSEYAENLLSLIRLYQEECPRTSPRLQAAIADLDFEFLIADLPKILGSMRLGTERIREIVRSLRLFSRMDEAEKKQVDIHDGIDSTLLILQHRLKPKANQSEIQVEKHYTALPLVECYAGQLNQVFMNILVNAIDALEEAFRSPHGLEAAVRQKAWGVSSQPSTPQIHICTEQQGDRIVIRIRDNGPGICEDARQRLFDPFYTTKPVGAGTGLGLSISYQIITETHGGSLDCVSAPGQGAEFIIQIPVRMAA